MIEIVPYRFEHLEHLNETHGEILMPPTLAVQLENHPSFTGMADGVVRGCAGVVKIWRGRWQAWAYVAKDTDVTASIQFVREIRSRVADIVKEGRVEASIVHGNDLHVRFAKLCGFEMETECARKYFQDGSDAHLMVRFV